MTDCATCGDPLTDEEVEAVRRDTDFVEHGDRGHLIRIAPRTIFDLPIAEWAMGGDEADHERSAT